MITVLEAVIGSRRYRKATSVKKKKNHTGANNVHEDIFHIFHSFTFVSVFIFLYR